EKHDLSLLCPAPPSLTLRALRGRKATLSSFSSARAEALPHRFGMLNFANHEQKQTERRRLYVDRIAGGHRNHRDSRRAPVACPRPEQRERTARRLLFESQTGRALGSALHG